MKKLRLLLFTDCDRNCPGCCNKDWDLDALPVCTSYAGYDEVMITGGEPMLNPLMVKQTIHAIRKENPAAKVYVYTAKLDDVDGAIGILRMADGFTVTLHEQADVREWLFFDDALPDDLFMHRSLRLNVFKGVYHGGNGGWITKHQLEWQKDCPLPADEVFMRHSAPSTLNRSNAK